MIEAVVLDVGHGNSALLRDGETSVVVDAPTKDHLLSALADDGIVHVALALVSHSDYDHCAGFIGLLLSEDVVVDEIRLNPDAFRESEFWGDLKTACRKAREMHGTKTRLELTSDLPDLEYGAIRLEILSPNPELAMGGVGSKDEEGRKVTANGMSAAVRVHLDGDPILLLPGDLDATGLAQLKSSGVDVTARVLLFPHHGGIPEGATTPAKMADFAKAFVDVVEPKTVIFSIGRGKHNTPRPEIVKAVRIHAPNVHIACTQLSERCAAESGVDHSHLGPRYAAGRSRQRCCIGSTVFRPHQGNSAPTPLEHATAVAVLPGRLCE